MIELIVTKSVQYARLANARVADEKQFEEKIVLFLGHIRAGGAPRKRLC